MIKLANEVLTVSTRPACKFGCRDVARYRKSERKEERKKKEEEKRVCVWGGGGGGGGLTNIHRSFEHLLFR